MIKYALFSTPGQGHVNPTLALAQELVARGEQVIYYLTEEFRPAVEATGATFRSFGKETFWGSQTNKPALPPGKKADMSLLFGGLMRNMIHLTTRMLPQLLKDVQELGLGVALEMDTLTPESLRVAVEQLAHDSSIHIKLQKMQHEIREAGGYQRAADAIMAYTHNAMCS